MSFSSETKTELCRPQVGDKQSTIAECYGILLYCNTFSGRLIRIVTECEAFAARLPKVFRKAFGFPFDAMPENTERAGKFTFSIEDPVKIQKIFDTYGYDAARILVHHINLGILEEEGSRVAFLRGAFLAGGSVTAPHKQYHLELVTDHYYVNREILAMLFELGFDAKSTSRAGNYIAYFKQSETIEDFLTTIGSPISAMNIMEAKISKSMTNSVNRRVNCDTANVSKTVDAALEQIEAIQKLQLGNLPDKLRETAQLRLDNPELSIAQLAQISVPPVTKSCISHRLRRLVEISQEE